MNWKVKLSALAKVVLLPMVAIILFQNCAEAPAPDTSQLNQSSIAPAPAIGGAPTPVGTPIPVVQQPPATPVAPVATPVPTPVTPAPPPPLVVTYPYTCVAFLNPASEFFPGGLCSYSCTGPSTYSAIASDSAYCNANPIGVPGTDIGWDANFTVYQSRPFSSCVITRNFSLVDYTMQAESKCR